MDLFEYYRVKQAPSLTNPTPDYTTSLYHLPPFLSWLGLRPRLSVFFLERSLKIMGEMSCFVYNSVRSVIEGSGLFINTFH